MANNESLILDGVELNSLGGTYVLRSVDLTPPRKRPEWIQGADADGSALVRDPLFDNRIITATLRVSQQSTMDLALAAVGTIVDKLEEAERQADGLALVWTPAGATKTVTFYVLSGEVDGIPVTKDGAERGWFINYPLLNIRMVCKPFGYGVEVTGPTATASTPIVTLTVPNVTGDVPAEGRLVVTDMASQSRRHVEWGLQQRFYDAATSLYRDSDDMTPLAGAQTTRTGAYDPNASGNNVIRSSALTSSPTAVCSTGNLGHVGVYRVKARVYPSSALIHVRLSWQEGDGPFTANPYAMVPVGGNFCEVDLGLIVIPPKVLGTQRWTGRIEAYSDTVGDTVDIDALWLIPAAEGYGKARAVYNYQAGSLVARDEFTGISSGTALDLRTAALGGSWATSGATTDFTAADAPLSTDETETRTTTADTGSGRFAILGSTAYTDTEAQVRFYFTAYPTTTSYRQGVIARWVDSSNYLRAVVQAVGGGGPNDWQVVVTKVVAGTPTDLATLPALAGGPGAPWLETASWYYMNLVVYASGRFIATVLDANGSTLISTEGSDSALATGGTLDDGKPGFVDYNNSGTAVTRYYDYFEVWTPPSEPIVCYSGQSLEIRHDDVIREDSSGSYYGSPPSYRGSRLLIPPAGDENRTSRIVVKARRNDVDTAGDDQIADSTKVECFWTPRYIAVPR